jgi:hypothetical protein
VKNLSYTTPRRLIDVLDAKIEQLRPKLPIGLGEWLIKINPVNLSIQLHSVSFRARPRELTAVLSSEHGELRVISQLLGGRASYGAFDGNIYVDGAAASPDPAAGPVVGCVSRVCYAMLCYAMRCYAMQCYAMLCYAMLCYAMLCYAMLYYDMICCYAMQCNIHLNR